MKNKLKISTLLIFFFVLLYFSNAKDFAVIGTNIFADSSKFVKKDSVSANRKDSTEGDFYSTRNKINNDSLKSKTIKDIDTSKEIINKEYWNPRFWVNGGLGMSSISNYSGFSFGGSINLNIGYILLATRINSSISLGTNMITGFREIAFLAGYAIVSKDLFASLATGISNLVGKKLNCFLVFCYNEVVFNQIGLPIDVQLFFKPNSYIGIGINFNANFNSYENFYGAMLCLQIGNLW
jgi:hypothetical protein